MFKNVGMCERDEVLITYHASIILIPHTELFEVAPRPAGMAWGSLANWAGNFLVGMLFPTMREKLGLYSFLVFAGITALLFVFLK